MKKNKKDFIHTGDVQAIETSLPKSANRIEKKPVAFGEKSGHIHVITGDYEMFEEPQSKDVYVTIGKMGAFSQHVHESVWKNSGFDSLELMQKVDHNPARLLPGKTYRIGIHQTYNPYKRIQEKVVD